MVSNDELRQQCIDKWMANHKNASLEKATQATHAMVADSFRTELQAAIENGKKHAKLSVVYLDKNFPPAELNQTLSMLK